MFVFRLSFSGKAVHRVSASEGQEAFFEGHVHAFSMLGGVPAGKVRYDNLTSAVARVLGFARARVETDRWTAFRSWAGLDAFYCQPGLQGAHEKGGVEGEVGRFRHNHLVPVPQVSTLARLNALLDVWDQEDEGRRRAGPQRTAAVPDRRLRDRQVPPAHRPGHRGRDGRLPGALRPGGQAR
jgi:transposase